MAPAERAAARELVADVDAFRDYVLSFGIFTDPDEGRRYIEMHHRRFLDTVDRIPNGTGALLEIGAAPFGMTLMMEARLDYAIHVLNYGSPGDVQLVSARHDRHLVLPCAASNVECDSLPYEDARFDVVVCAEVIEHLTFDPTHMLVELHRILKPEGCLVLTTPNALRLFYRYDSTRRIMHGYNVHDSYSGYGPYGRHNHEYTPAELRALVEGCGFVVTTLDIYDVEPRPQGRRDRAYPWLLSLLFGIDAAEVVRLRGSQITILARPGREPKAFRPDSLYKSTHALEKARAMFPRIP
jgi:predicted SAM-dependent methyltransferase